MRDATYDLFLLAVVLGRLAGETVEDVPDDIHAVVTHPAQSVDVPDARYPLAHEIEHVGVQRLDTRLDAPHARVPEELDLVPGQVRFDLVEQIVAGPFLDELRQEGLQVGHL